MYSGDIEAEQNILNECKYADDLMEVIDLIGRISSKLFNDFESEKQKEWRKATNTLMDLVRQKQFERISKLFGFIEVGGPEAKEYSWSKFKDLFGDAKSGLKYDIMHLLNPQLKFGGIIYSKDEEDFRKEADELIKRREDMDK